MKRNNIILTLVLAVGIIFSQVIPTQYGGVDTRKVDEPLEDQTIEQSLMSSSVSLEKEIDPTTYLLGPGDVMGIDIISSTHMVFTLTVTPTGDLLIPSAGKIYVSGQTLESAIAGVTSLIQNQYKNSKVHVSLMDVRSFLIPVTGAVYSPGHTEVTATQRLWTVLKSANGVHPYADVNRINIIKAVKTARIVSIEEYFLDGELMNNPMIEMGDRIHVPFMDGISSLMIHQVHATEEVVWVTGYVHYPGSYKYDPDYTMDDYISLAGGSVKQGSEKSAEILLNGKKSNNNNILPGSTVHVPESFTSKVFGGASIMQTITAFASLYLTYIAATK